MTLNRKMKVLLVLLTMVALASSFTPSNHQQNKKNVLALKVSLAYSSQYYQAAGFPLPVTNNLQSKDKAESSSSADTAEQQQQQQLTKYERKWFLRFEQMKEFIKEHGHCNPSVESHRLLANWSKNQRMHYKYLTNGTPRSTLTRERLHLLTSIGFVWSIKDAKWFQHYEQLKVFYFQHGHCNVPSFSSRQLSSQHKQLARWVTHQRQKYKRAVDADSSSPSQPLSPEQIALLNDIHFTWYPRNDIWWQRFASLRQFKNDHGHCHVPQRYAADPDLGIWCHHQRRACKEYLLSCLIERTMEGVTVTGLTADRLAALRAIAFCGLPDPENAPQVAAFLASQPEDTLDSWYSVVGQNSSKDWKGPNDFWNGKIDIGNVCTKKMRTLRVSIGFSGVLLLVFEYGHFDLQHSSNKLSVLWRPSLSTLSWVSRRTAADKLRSTEELKKSLEALNIQSLMVEKGATGTLRLCENDFLKCVALITV